MFQSTRPRGARRQLRARYALTHDVSIHAPTRGATLPRRMLGRQQRRFQSTRPRGARRDGAIEGARRARVSIHAPTRGATFAILGAVLHHALVSIHAPTRGATLAVLLTGISSDTFQSTRPRGARRRAPRGGRAGVRVSIHAPTRGATAAADARAEVVAFQSTRPRGARHVGHAASGSPAAFQSTRPRGARPAPVLPATLVTGFQSTRPRGARRHHPAIRIGRKNVSIHAPTRGATGSRRLWRWPQPCFNPRAHAGRDMPAPGLARRSPAFQSTRPRGARPEAEREAAPAEAVSIHAPTRGATRTP